jgi:hypothetical protein
MAYEKHPELSMDQEKLGAQNFSDQGQTRPPSLHSSEADVGYDLFLQSERLTRDEKKGSLDHEREWEEDSKRVRRKIDLRVLPIMYAILRLI